MSRLTILSVLVIGLPLIGCVQAPTAPGTATAGPAATAQLGPMPVGPDTPLISADQGQLSHTPEFSTGNSIAHSPLWPIVTVTGPHAQ